MLSLTGESSKRKPSQSSSSSSSGLCGCVVVGGFLCRHFGSSQLGESEFAFSSYPTCRRARLRLAGGYVLVGLLRAHGRVREAFRGVRRAFPWGPQGGGPARAGGTGANVTSIVLRMAHAAGDLIEPIARGTGGSVCLRRGRAKKWGRGGFWGRRERGLFWCGASPPCFCGGAVFSLAALSQRSPPAFPLLSPPSLGWNRGADRPPP